MTHDEPSIGAVRVRISSPDPYAGLRGKDYIAARGLAKQALSSKQPRVEEDCQCLRCWQERKLEGVQRLLANFITPVSGPQAIDKREPSPRQNFAFSTGHADPLARGEGLRFYVVSSSRR